MAGVVGRRRFLKLCVLAVPGVALGIPLPVGVPVRKRRAAMDVGVIGSGMELVRKSEWTDTVPLLAKLRRAEAFDRLTVHHLGRPNAHTDLHVVMHDLHGVLDAHRKRRFGDIGYHFVVDCAGRVWEGRSLSYEGAHVSGQNPRNIGVMLLGNFEEQWPCSKQRVSLKQLVELLRGHYGIRRRCIYGHRDLGQSVCPGRNLYSYVKKMRA